MQPNEMKEVDFYTYCKSCVYKNAQESEEPCCDCVAEPVNQWSHKPVKYKKRVKHSRYHLEEVENE